MQIACILINYRNPEDTLECLESLRKSGTASFKIFLVNNYSSDGSGEILQDYLRKSKMAFTYLDPEENLGFAGGVNLGVRSALLENENPSHILLLNNDTVVAENFTHEATNLARLYPNDVIAGSVVDYSTDRPSFNIGRISPFTGRIAHILKKDFAGEIDFVSGCLMLAPTKVFKDVGLFDDRLFMYCEDVDFCFRLKKNDVHIRYCPSLTTRHKFSASAQTAQTPKEYYGIRNQTYVVLLRGSPVQKILYLIFLLFMPFYKMARRPRLFMQAMRGLRDGLTGKLGRYESSGRDHFLTK